MPLYPPALDDRSFDDLVAESLSRIPAHTPEWTHPRVGDPGRTIVELFAWLTDTMLYRANLIPERQRLAFLRLLGVPVRPATAARGVVALAFDSADVTTATTLAPLAAVKAALPFETRHGVTVLPVTAEAYYKRALSAAEQQGKEELLRGLQAVYRLPARAVPYETTPVFVGGAAEPGAFDVVARTVDRCLWLALLAPKPDQVAAVRTTLGSRTEGVPQLLSIGVVPAIEVPALFGEIGPRPRVPHVWEISSVDARGKVAYHTLDLVADSSEGLTQRGVLRVALPGEEFIGAPGNDPRATLDAGVGDRPPRLDAADKAARLVAWIRLRPTAPIGSLALSWVGVNAAEVDQRQTVTNRVVGQSNGAPDQVLPLGAASVEPETLVVQVDETGRGYQQWTRVDDLAIAGRDDAAYRLDAEAGTIQFGDGVRGRIPEPGRRIRVAVLRAGGGAAGNLPPGTLKDISAKDLDGAPVTLKLKVQQSVATVGGDDAESLAAAERRIPALFRHRDRAVTEEDYKQLSATTPAVRLGRVEVLPRFKPQQRRSDVPGVVTVMVLPQKDGTSAPAPRPDRPLLEAVHRWLDDRRPLGTELYVVGCEYVPVAIAVGVDVRDGFGEDAVMHAVRNALRAYLWPLAPGGTDGAGWPLERALNDRELEVVVARVGGVSSVHWLRLFTQRNGEWGEVPAADRAGTVRLDLRRWQLPELLAVLVMTDGAPPNDLRGLLTSGSTSLVPAGIAVPVVPEVC